METKTCRCNNAVIEDLFTTSQWDLKDYIGAIKVRLSIGRNHYKVKPGLYKIGAPNEKSDVFVTANYKLSFDILRRNLEGIDAWILILDTNGVNVWCAAGKGTFGTDELVKQINLTRLHQVISHRKIIVPQLGAPGISKYQVEEKTEFKVKYGPVRASDLKNYIAKRHQATESMRKVSFNLTDRLKLTPVEFANSFLYFLFLLLFFGVVSGINTSGFSIELAFKTGIRDVFLASLAYLSGVFFTPILLPWMPSRYFAAKGIMVSCVIIMIVAFFGFFVSTALLLGWLAFSASISSYLSMNFTGASVYTSMSGVRKEMRIFIPIQIILGLLGFTIILIHKF